LLRNLVLLRTYSYCTENFTEKSTVLGKVDFCARVCELDVKDIPLFMSTVTICVPCTRECNSKRAFFSSHHTPPALNQNRRLTNKQQQKSFRHGRGRGGKTERWM